MAYGWGYITAKRGWPLVGAFIWGIVIPVLLGVNWADDLPEASQGGVQGEVITPERLPRPGVWAEQPPLQQESRQDARKLKVAQILSQWVSETLSRHKVQVALVTRRGPKLIQQFDPTGMSHAGFVLWDPVRQEWITYNLLSDPQTHHHTAKIRRARLEDFYLAQRGYEAKAMILVPPASVQGLLYTHLTQRPYQQYFPAQRYNLISPITTLNSFNCLKWVLFNWMAALKPEASLDQWHRAMAEALALIPLKVRWPVRLTLQGRPNIDWSELPKDGVLRTPMVYSFYRSNLFEQILCYPNDGFIPPKNRRPNGGAQRT